MAKTRANRARKVKPSTVTAALVRSALAIAPKIAAKAIFVYGDVPIKFEMLRKTGKSLKLVLVTSRPGIAGRANAVFTHSIQLPEVPLSRIGQVKVSIIMAISGKIINPRDRIIFLTGGPGQESLDGVVVIDVREEFAPLASPETLDFQSDAEHTVFDHLVRLALSIANEGREGHPVGSIFILGDTKEVLKHVEQMIINPFKGHTEECRQILNPSVRETIKELAQLDGAFIVRSNGIIETAGAYISAQMVPDALPQGLGARHYSAAAITAATRAIAITVSQSTGDVYIFKDGRVVTYIEKNPT